MVTAVAWAMSCDDCPVRTWESLPKLTRLSPTHDLRHLYQVNCRLHDRLFVEDEVSDLCLSVLVRISGAKVGCRSPAGRNNSPRQFRQEMYRPSETSAAVEHSDQAEA